MSEHHTCTRDCYDGYYCPDNEPELAIWERSKAIHTHSMGIKYAIEWERVTREGNRRFAFWRSQFKAAGLPVV